MPLINLAIALFALVAIESSSQSLGRTYAVLLAAAILLDICWFILFSYEIWLVWLSLLPPVLVSYDIVSYNFMNADDVMIHDVVQCDKINIVGFRYVYS